MVLDKGAAVPMGAIRQGKRYRSGGEGGGQHCTRPWNGDVKQHGSQRPVAAIQQPDRDAHGVIYWDIDAFQHPNCISLQQPHFQQHIDWHVQRAACVCTLASGLLSLAHTSHRHPVSMAMSGRDAAFPHFPNPFPSIAFLLPSSIIFARLVFVIPK